MPDDPRAPTVAGRFRQVAAAQPGRPAFREDSRCVTYAELDEQSDRVAVAISDCVPAGARVAIEYPAGAPFAVCALAALKCGGTFVPLDPNWPEARKQSVLAESDAALLLSDRDTLDGWRGRVLPLHSARSAGAASDIACILFTSGSTGRPRGVLVPDSALLKASSDYRDIMGLTPDDRVAWLAPVSVGAMLLPFLGGLLSGACVLPFNVASRGLPAFREWLKAESVTILPMVSSLFRAFAQYVSPGERFDALRWIKLGGEPVLRQDAMLFQERFGPGCSLLNGLGITELAGNVCFHRLSRAASLAQATLPVGQAVPDFELLILGEDGGPRSDGQPGEIAVRSRRAVGGYLNDPERTRQKFAPLPDLPDVPVFRTGDLGRLLPDGELLHLGRTDSRVKIRGYFVDPVEVEAALLEVAGVRDAVVVARDDAGAAQLAAFYTGDAALDGAFLREQLGHRLPPHMIPGTFARLESLPRLRGGKVDRMALAQREAPPVSIENGAPRDWIEVELLKIWEWALGRKGFGVRDSFVALGGDSLSTVRVFAAIERYMDVNLPLNTIRDHPTVEQLAAHIRNVGAGTAWETAVLLGLGTESAPPLFVVPGAGVDVVQIVDLAARLGPDITVYALRYPGLDGTPICYRSTEDLAAHFIHAVRRIQPRGPYRLSGASYGGVVAYEMAQQLHAVGERVEFLGLLDAYGPGYGRVKPQAWWRHGPLICLRWWLPIGNKEQLTVSNVLDGIRMRWDHAMWRVKTWWRPSGVTAPYEKRYRYANAAAFAARARYRFPPFDGDVDLFRARETLPAFLYEMKPDLNWGRLVNGKLRVHEVPGNHTRFIHEPHVAELADAIRKRLAESHGPTSRRN